MVLLHGLFGSGSNLGVLARSLRESCTVYSPDLPNHGRSAWLPDPDLPCLADSVARWMDAEGLSQVHLVGHSLGGKVAMQLALQDPARVLSLVVADISPVVYPASHDGVFAALAAVAGARCAHREDAARLMAVHLEDERVIQFLLTSLQRNAEGVLDWRFDREGLESAYSQLLAAPGAAANYPGPVLFIAGGESDYIRQEHWPVITRLFPQASFKAIAGSGHWLHAEKPELFNSIVKRFLAAQKQRMLDGNVTEEGGTR